MTPRARQGLGLLGHGLYVLFATLIIGVAFYFAALIMLRDIALEAERLGLTPQLGQ